MGTTSVSNLKCTITKVCFAKDGFAICECRAHSKIPDEAIRHFDDKNGGKTFTALGYGLSTQVRQNVLLSGQWEHSKKFKVLQLRISECTDHVGSSKKEIVAYLSSNILKGVGKKTAEKIYDVFGDKVIQVIEKDPRRLLDIPGIKEKRLEQIITSFEAHRDFHNLTLLLSKYGVSYRTVVRIQKALGEHSVRKVKENPYILCRVNGFGFKTADALAAEMGYPGNAAARVQGAVIYVLDQAQTEGHLYLTRYQLLDRCCSADVLNNKPSAVQVPPAAVNQVINTMIERGLLAKAALDGTTFLPMDEPIYRTSAYMHETFAAEKIASKLTADTGKKGKWQQIIKDTQEKLGVCLDDRQAEAAIMGLSNPLSVITGGPGTGKTTSLNVIVQSYLAAYPKREIALAAPTGRAARRMSEQTNMPASTLHSLLGLRPDVWTDFTKEPDPTEMIKADLLVVDESSMVDAHLLAELMYRVKSKTQIIFLGDADQLPSVGAGNVLAQLLLNDAVPNVCLEKIFRQSEDSIIPVNASNIRKGSKELQFNKYFRLIHCENEEEGAAMVTQLVRRSMDRGTFDCTQILCPMKRRGVVCTSNLNQVLHDIVNPASPQLKEAEVGGILFREGDKVMQTKNISGASNGDIGRITQISGDPKDQETFSLTVQFDSSPEPLSYNYEEALDLIHALAITIHKSQGSEFDAVIVPIFKSMSFFLRRNLLYTAVTRAKKQVILVSDGTGIDMAINKEDTSKRNTLLSNFISESIPSSSNSN